MQASKPSPKMNHCVPTRTWPVVCALATLLAASVSTSFADQPLITKNNTFFIPFTTPAEEHQAGVVELFVSGDKGENWTLYQQRGPTENRFSFRAGADGEYWFSIRTLDMNGKATSRKKHAPQMKVIVDQTQPQFELTADAATPGQVHANWRILDANCVPASVRIEYKTGAKGPWQALSIHGGSTVKADGTIVGEVDWSLPRTAEDIFIRAEARDKADNLTVIERQIASSDAAKNTIVPLPAPLPTVEVAKSPTGSPSIKPASRLPVVSAAPKSGGPAVMTNQYWTPTPAPANSQADSTPSANYPATAEANPWVIPKTTPKPVAPNSIPNAIPNPHVNQLPNPASQLPDPAQQGSAQPQPALSPLPAPQIAPSAPQLPFNPLRPPKSSTTAGTELPTPTPTWSQVPPLTPTPAIGRSVNPNPPVASSFEPLPPAPASEAETLESQYQPANEPNDSPSGMAHPVDWRISNSRKFHLDYSVDASNAEKVHRVEVWYTDDGGQSWHHHGDDDDRISPYLARVNDDGMYGFRLLVQSREGLTMRPPMPGDPADIWIRVDKTPPTVAIRSAVYGRGNEQGKLAITWEAEDEDLFPSPISLLYSDAPTGPWRLIADNLANTGQYDWKAGDRVPSGIYLQIRARDRAGNVATQTLSEPIKAEGLAPQGHIRGFRPASHQVEAGK